MFAVLSSTRKVSTIVIAFLSVLWLSACQIALPGAGGGPKINTARPVPVALLVPGGSAQSTDNSLAQALENAARMAMADLDGVTIDLRVYNTAGNREQAARMATQAAQDGAKIILGPLYAQNANAAGLAVAGRGINVLSFSNNAEIAGGNVFILGHTFSNTANRLVRYSAAQGRKSIMVVHANTTSEAAARDAIQRAARSANASLVGTASFELSQNSIINLVRPVSKQIQDARAQTVMFTSDNFAALSLWGSLLPENGVKPPQVQFAGLLRWDVDPRVREIRGLQNGWFAMPDPDLSALFSARYQSTYGSTPHPVAGLAYDGVAAIGALIRSGSPDALTVSSLTQSSGFAGVNGVFRLRPNGTNERALAVAQIQGNQIVVIDPAPRSFSGAGF